MMSPQALQAVVNADVVDDVVDDVEDDVVKIFFPPGYPSQSGCSSLVVDLLILSNNKYVCIVDAGRLIFFPLILILVTWSLRENT
jgi:hypothetical protein